MKSFVYELQETNSLGENIPISMLSVMQPIAQHFAPSTYMWCVSKQFLVCIKSKKKIDNELNKAFQLSVLKI